MRVLEISRGLGVGGAEVALLNRLAVAPAHVESLVVNTKPELADLAPALAAECSGVVDLPLMRPKGVGRLIDVARQFAADAVVYHSPADVVVAAIPMKRLGSALQVAVVHNEACRAVLRPGLAVANRAVDLHLAVSSAAMTGQQTRGAQRVEVHMLGSPRIEFPERGVSRAQLGLDDETVTLISVGRQARQKRIDVLLRAFRSALDASAPNDVAMLIAGDGPELAKNRRLAIGLGLERHVRFLGVVRPTAGLFAAADALVVSSDYEGLPMVVFEAGQVGIPVISFDVGGIREALPCISRSRLAPASDVGALATRISEFVGDPALRLALTSEAMSFVSFDSRSQASVFYRRLGTLTGKGPGSSE